MPRPATNSEPDDRESIRLDHFLQREGAAETGGHAKLMIQNGEVQVNGEPETRRRRRVSNGDCVEIHGSTIDVQLGHEE